MMRQFSGLFFIIQLIKISFLDAFTKPCNASLETVLEVARCPTSSTSYEEAAQQKNCSSLPLDKTGCESFQYHCVLSEGLNTAIEVCAPSINIIGYVCAKFTSKFKSIVRVDDQSCKNSKAGCPYSYNSTMAFMYQQCYTKVYDIHSTETKPRLNSSTTKGPSKENFENKSLIAVVVIIPVLVLFIVPVTAFICWRRKKRREDQKNRPNNLEMDELVIAGNVLQNGNQIDPLLSEKNAELENDENSKRAEVKTEVSTGVKHKRFLLKGAVRYLIKCLKYPNKAWTKETIKGEINNLLKEIQVAGDRKILMEFVEILNKDSEIQQKINDCEVEMHQTFLSALRMYDATELSMDEGCVCFLISFSDDKPLKNFLEDFQQGSKDFINWISRILLNKKFLGIFQIHPEIVTWRASGIKVYKGSELLQEENLEVPLIGTYKDITEDVEGSELLQGENLEVPLVVTYKDITEDVEEHKVVKGVQPSTPLTATIKDTTDVEGSELPKEENQSSQLIGAYKDTPKVDGKEKTDEHAFEGVFRFVKLLMAVVINMTQIYRDLLEKEVPHAKLEITLKSSDIYENLSQTEKSDLSKAVQFGYSNFKIPLMYKLLRHICVNIPEPTDGWGPLFMPNANDVSVGDDIERIKLIQYGLVQKTWTLSSQESFRHHVFGTISASVSQKLFDRYWTVVSDVCQRMQIYTGKKYMKTLEKIHEMSFEEMQKGLLKLTPEKKSQKEADFLTELTEHKMLQEEEPTAQKIGTVKDTTNIQGAELPSDEDLSTTFVEAYKDTADLDVHLKGQKKIHEEAKMEVARHTRKKQFNKDDPLLLNMLKDFRTFLFKSKLEEEIILDDFRARQNKYPAYKHVKTRELSFACCEESRIKDRAWDFARDGFFYEGYGLVTTCFHCGFVTGDWKEEDEIHAKHKKFNEACNFVKYVQLCILKTK